MNDNSKYIDMFIEEAVEQLQQLNQDLLELEKNGFDIERMNSAYRTIHTIKGSSAVLEINNIKEIAHAMEDLFDILREIQQDPDEAMLELWFDSVDIIEKMVNELSIKGKITISGKNAINRIRKMIGSKSTRTKKTDTKNNSKGELQYNLTHEQKSTLMESLSDGKKVYDIEVSLDENTRFKEGRIYQLIKAIEIDCLLIATAPEIFELTDDMNSINILMATTIGKKKLGNYFNNATGISGIEVKTLNPKNLDEFGGGDEDEAGETSNLDSKTQTGVTKGDTVRVKSKLLDRLLDLVGEIMITNIRINQIATDMRHRELRQVLKNSERLIGELQDTVLHTRMVPVDHIFKRFPRMVRDMAKERGKEVNFEMIGYDIEIDRSLLDDIGDSLVHLLRNAVDHGIESEADRKKLGKPLKSKIKLSAYREQSNIVVTVEDDGRGIKKSKIIDNAIRKKVITAEDIETMDDKQALQLVFQPGVSTAEKITEVSGRGVGLDVVKSKVEGLGGTVRIETIEGKGTKFTIKLPPSMSIISAMLVEINCEKYAIPLENLSETTKLTVDQIHEFAETGMFRLREEVLPVFNIHSQFGGNVNEFTEDMPVLIVEKDENKAGLVVSRFIGQQEIVVKNLSKDLRGTSYFSGATILGDGNVALILDVGALL